MTLVIRLFATLVLGLPLVAASALVFAQTADVAIPDVGTKLVYRTLDHQTKSERKQTWTVVDLPDRGPAVFGLAGGSDVSVYDKATWNWVADLRRGTERFSASPNDGTFSWPLAVGKRWTASYEYTDHESGKSWNPVVSFWKVVKFEDVTVPAGTFKAFKLESSPGTNNSTSITIWYAPAVKAMVKRVRERDQSHYLGYGKFTTELVEVK